MDNGHGACVADEHVACTKQVIQELPVSHWSVTAHCTGGESLPTLHTSLPHHCHFIGSRGGALRANLSRPILWLQRARRQGLEGGLWVLLQRAPLKAKKLKLYLWVHTMQATRSQASQGSLPTLRPLANIRHFSLRYVKLFNISYCDLIKFVCLESEKEKVCWIPYPSSFLPPGPTPLTHSLFVRAYIPLIHKDSCIGVPVGSAGLPQWLFQSWWSNTRRHQRCLPLCCRWVVEFYFHITPKDVTNSHNRMHRKFQSCLHILAVRPPNTIVYSEHDATHHHL